MYLIGGLCWRGKWWENPGRLSAEILQQGLHHGARHLQHPQNVSLSQNCTGRLVFWPMREDVWIMQSHWELDDRNPCFSHRYFQAGGSPEHVIQLLSENYSAVAQTVNLLAEWLIQMGRWLTAISLYCFLGKKPFSSTSITWWPFINL